MAVNPRLYFQELIDAGVREGKANPGNPWTYDEVKEYLVKSKTNDKINKSRVWDKWVDGSAIAKKYADPLQKMFLGPNSEAEFNAHKLDKVHSNCEFCANYMKFSSWKKAGFAAATKAPDVVSTTSAVPLASATAPIGLDDAPRGNELRTLSEQAVSTAVYRWTSESVFCDRDFEFTMMVSDEARGELAATCAYSDYSLTIDLGPGTPETKTPDVDRTQRFIRVRCEFKRLDVKLDGSAYEMLFRLKQEISAALSERIDPRAHGWSIRNTNANGDHYNNKKPLAEDMIGRLVAHSGVDLPGEVNISINVTVPVDMLDRRVVPDDSSAGERNAALVMENVLRLFNAKPNAAEIKLATVVLKGTRRDK